VPAETEIVVRLQVRHVPRHVPNTWKRIVAGVCSPVGGSVEELCASHFDSGLRSSDAKDSVLKLRMRPALEYIGNARTVSQ